MKHVKEYWIRKFYYAQMFDGDALLKFEQIDAQVQFLFNFKSDACGISEVGIIRFVLGSLRFRFRPNFNIVGCLSRVN